MKSKVLYMCEGKVLMDSLNYSTVNLTNLTKYIQEKKIIIS